MSLWTNRQNNFRYLSYNFAITVLVLFLEVFTLWGCAAKTPPNQVGSDISILGKWSGDYPVSQLPRLPAGQQQTSVGYIDDMATFIFFWRAYMPDEILPAVDFSKDLVVFTRNLKYYNRQSILTIRREGGTAEIIVMETMSTRPVEDSVSLAMAIIPRSGITFIKSGKAVIRVTNYSASGNF